MSEEIKIKIFSIFLIILNGGTAIYDFLIGFKIIPINVDFFRLSFGISLALLTIIAAFNTFFLKEWARKFIIVLFLIFIAFVIFEYIFVSPEEELKELLKTGNVVYYKNLNFVPIIIYFVFILFFLRKRTVQIFKKYAQGKINLSK